MSIPPLADKAIVLGAIAHDWRAAVKLAGDALVRSDAALPTYIQDMIRMIEKHGPYVVIAPGLALAHARPGPAVRADALAVVTLAEPVSFGHPHNDPVAVVLALATASAENHLAAVAELANVFNDTDAVSRLANASTADEVRAVFA